MNIRRDRRSWAFLSLLVLSLVVLLLLGTRAASRFSETGKVWVAAAGLAPGATVRPDDLRLARVRGGSVPDGIIRSREDIQGRQLTRRKQEGTPFSSSDFAAEESDDPGPGLADRIPEGRVLMPLRVTPNLFPASRLRRGDRIDVLATHARSGETTPVVRDGFLMGQNRRDSVSRSEPAARGPLGIDLGGGERRVAPPIYMYLAVHPEDAAGLSRAQAQGARLKIVMHSRGDVRAGRVRDLEGPKGVEVELIRGDERESVAVAY